MVTDGPDGPAPMVPAAAQLERDRARRAAPLSTARRVAGWLLAVVGSAVLTVVFLRAGTGADALTLNFLCHLTLVVFVAIVGGWWPAVATAVLGTMLINWFFTPPTGMLLIHEPLNLWALVLFLAVAAGVARVVDIEARRTAEARAARHQAAMLFDLAGGVISEGRSVQALLDRLRESYALTGVALARRPAHSTDPDQWRVLLASGRSATGRADWALTVTVDEDHVLLVDGFSPADPEQGIVEAFAGRIGAVLQQQALDEARLQSQELAAGNAMRTALLAAVSHDLRTPLAGIKASVSSLRMGDVVLSEEDTAELLANIEESTDQLTERIDDLLDMSRIQSGNLIVHRVPLELADLAGAAVRAACAPEQLSRISTDIPLDTPPVLGDHGLLVRVIANLVENAFRHSGHGPVTLQAATVADSVQLRIIDHGPGVAHPDQERIFQPLQRLGDRDNTTGVGLGLAVARGLAEGVGGQLNAEDTPGGGLTMVLSLRAAPLPPPGASGVPAAEHDAAERDAADHDAADHDAADHDTEEVLP
ncbi:sensor histidine kinase [Kocuria arenosa]|uniref:sensor histidine kinase n=1 Tax=Kocuria arenosa TaxID=3071446 RepID=UPI0034D66D98